METDKPLSAREFHLLAIVPQRLAVEDLEALLVRQLAYLPVDGVSNVF